MNSASGSPISNAIKLVIAAPPFVDVLDLMEDLARYLPDSVLRDFKLGNLDALRLEFPVASSNVALYALLGHVQYIAVQEILLSNADGVLLFVDMEASQREANIQNVLQTSQSLRRQGHDIRQLALAFLYYRCELATTNTIVQWDQLLECEQNQIPRFCMYNGEISSMAQAIQALLQKLLEAVDHTPSER